MAQETGDPARFTTGRVIAQSIAVFLRHPLVFAGLGILIAIPDTAFNLWYDRWSETAFEDPRATFGSPWIMVGIIAVSAGVVATIDVATYAVTEAAFTIGLFEDLSGGKVNFLRCLRGCLPALPRLLALSLLLGWIFAVCMALVMLIGIEGSTLVMYGAIGLGGLVAFVLMVNWWVVVPAITVEEVGAFASLGRSLDLTRGHRWRILALVLLPSVFGVISAVLLALTVDKTGLVYRIVDFGIDTITALAGTMLSAVGYAALRAEKEGLSVTRVDVAAVFD